MGQAKRLRNCGKELGHPVCSKKQGSQGVGGVVKGGALTGRPQKNKDVCRDEDAGNRGALSVPRVGVVRHWRLAESRGP